MVMLSVEREYREEWIWGLRYGRVLVVELEVFVDNRWRCAYVCV